MPEINIKVRDKCAEGEGVVICNNSDYTVVWDLDSEWEPYSTRTMRVNLADGTYQDVVFTGNSAALPVLTASGWVSVGLYAGDLHTSRAARLLALSSVLTPGGSPAAPAEDVYAQIMAKLNELSTVSPEDIAKAVEDYLAEHPAASASMRVEGGYIQFSGDGKTWENVIALADLKGPKGDTGDTGPHGPKGDTGPQGNPGKDGAGMDVTGATVGQIAKISAVDDNGKPTAWETIDGYTGQVTVDNLTNPDHPTDLVQYAAFQAAVPMVQQMGISGATVGQIIKVKAVNSDGCPTAWEPVDMPSGGGETMNLSWKHIRDVELTPDAIEAIVSTTDAGNTFSYDEIMLELIPNLAGYFYVRASQSVNLSANVAMWVTNSKYTQMHLGLLGKKLAITSASRTDGSLGFSNNYGGNGDIDKISTIVFGASASVGAAFTVKIWGR